MTTTTMDVILSKLQNIKQKGDNYISDCPSCGDTKQHLSIATGNDGKTILKCFKGCAVEQITQSIGMAVTDLFLPADAPLPQKRKRTIAKETTYDIVDRNGGVKAQHVRIEHEDGSKSFQWRRNGSTGLQGLRVENLPLYGWEWLTEETEKDTRPVIITEGEKAAHALRDAGHLALATVTGASSCPSEDALIPLLLFNTRIILWPDNDDPGRAHMNKVASRLVKIGIHPSIIRWEDAPPKGDAYDCITLGNSVDALLTSAQSWGGQPAAITIENDVIEQEIVVGSHSIIFRAEDTRKEKTGVHARVDILADGDRLAWDTFNIGRDSDRVRIANSAFKQLPSDLASAYTSAGLKRDMDDFCASIWDKHIEYNIGQLMTGNPVSESQTFILNPFIVNKGGTLIFAPPGRGKSYTAMLMAVSIDAGLSTIWDVKQGRVLYINLERSRESMAHRLARVNEALGLPVDRGLIFLNARGKSLNDIADAAADTINRHSISTVFLDSISRSGMGDLNDNQPANRIIDTLNRIAPTWLAIAHTPRSSEDHVFGSQHFDAGADVIVQIRTEEKDGILGLGLQITKANDIKKPKMLCYALCFNGVGLAEARRAKQGEFGELYVGVESSLTDEVTNYIIEMGDATTTQIAEATGRHVQSVSKLLRAGNQFVKTRKSGRDQYYGMASNY